MRQATLINGDRLITATGTLPIMKDGHQDDFTRSDRPIDSPWVDASVQYPTMFDPTNIEDNKATFLPLVLDTYSAEPTNLVGHHLIYQDIGLSDNFEVGVNWISDDDERLIGQVGPAIFIDPNSSDPLEMGMWANFDISIFGGIIYAQNVFRQTPISEVFDSSYYDVLGSGVANQAALINLAYLDSPVFYNRIALRVTSGMVQIYWNGRAIGAPSTAPAFSTGRTKVGIHVISTKVDIGHNGLSGNPITEIIPDLADNWYWRPL